MLKRLYKTGFTTLNDLIYPHLPNPHQNPSSSSPFETSNKINYRYRQISRICQKPESSLAPTTPEIKHQKSKEFAQVRGFTVCSTLQNFQKVSTRNREGGVDFGV